MEKVSHAGPTSRSNDVATPLVWGAESPPVIGLNDTPLMAK